MGQVLLGPQPRLEQGMVAGPSACPLCWGGLFLPTFFFFLIFWGSILFLCWDFSSSEVALDELRWTNRAVMLGSGEIPYPAVIYLVQRVPLHSRHAPHVCHDYFPLPFHPQPLKLNELPPLPYATPP